MMIKLIFNEKQQQLKSSSGDEEELDRREACRWLKMDLMSNVSKTE